MAGGSSPHVAHVGGGRQGLGTVGIAFLLHPAVVVNIDPSEVKPSHKTQKQQCDSIVYLQVLEVLVAGAGDGVGGVDLGVVADHDGVPRVAADPELGAEGAVVVGAAVVAGAGEAAVHLGRGVAQQGWNKSFSASKYDIHQHKHDNMNVNPFFKIS